MPEYTQEEFDAGLRKMLQEARNEGKQFCSIRSGDLHARVFVRKAKNHRMRMACRAMCKLWKQQGSHEDRVIHTTSSCQSSTIKIEFSTDV